MFPEKIYLFANWKMYLDLDESTMMASVLNKEAKSFENNIKMVLFPSALAMDSVVKEVKGALCIGAQNVYWVEKGGYTGEVSATMVKSAGAEYCLIGHSERRHLFGETEHQTRQKMEAALAAGLTPVLCVGEKTEEKENDKTLIVVEEQIRAALDGLTWPSDRELIVAYEPVWAIGTGLACDPMEAEQIHEHIYSLLRKLISGTIPVLLYGGSVRPNNVVDYLKQPHINGVLVGGASTKKDSWMEIVKVCTV